MKTLKNFTGTRKCHGRLLSAVLFAGLLAFGSPAAHAQNAKLDLSHLDKLASKASKVTDVNLGGPMLKLAAENLAAKKHGEKGAAMQGMVQQLKGIYVKSFEFSKPGEYSHADVESVLKQLKSGGWKPVVNVKEEKSGETTNIYVMEEGGEIVGMAVVAAEPQELTVVNLVGPINFSTLGSLGALGQLGSLGGNGGNSKPQLQPRNESGQKPDQQGDAK